MFVSQMLAGAVARWPDRVAIVDEAGELTFAELAGRVGRLVNALRGLSLEPGDRIIDLQKNWHTYIETDLACAIAGVVRVPVNPRLTAADWRYIAADAGARAIFYGPEFAEAAEILIGEVESLEVAVGTSGAGSGEDFEELLARASPSPATRLEQPAEILALHYSSGTTGRPKGCVRTAANRFVGTADMIASVCEGSVGSDEVFLHAGPLTHASGLFMLPYLASGATQVLLSSFDEERVIAEIERHRVTATVLVPTMLERVLAALPSGRAPDEQVPSLRRIAYAGAPMAPARITNALQLIGPRLVQFYGMVEAIPPLTVLSRADHVHADRLTAAGRPVLGAAIRIVDDDFQPVPDGESGELLVGGSHVMAGYWEDDDSTGKTLRDGWLRTGDLARVDADGLIHLGDRMADMIISGGYNVMPREIEEVIDRDPDVAEVAVVGVPDVEWGEVVTAVIVPAPGASPSGDAISAACAAALSGFKKPRAIHFAAELPKGSTGKIMRRRVRENLEAGAG
ncbi:MAG: AMP-binding protein [Actinobacteria bacterium]|nr:AMP-binding protein [Actinomycetota bacterium]